MRAHKKLKTAATSVRHHRPVKLKPHHRKAYRPSQLIFLVVAAVFVIFTSLETGIIIGRGAATPPNAVANTEQPAGSVTVVRSSYGFSFATDSNTVSLAGTEVDAKGTAHTVNQDELAKNKPVTTVILRPRSGAVSGAEAAAQLTMQVNPDAKAYAALKTKPENSGKSAGEVAAGMFPMTSTSELDISVSSSTSDTIAGGVPVQKTVYQYTPKFKGAPSYAIVWSGVSEGRAFALKLQGLVGDSSIPAVFQTVFDSLNIASAEGVLGASTDLLMPKVSADTLKLDSKYLSDAISPAVVKIYHVICGTLTLEGQALTDNSCTGFSGSGFFVSSDGYIATNGHVVVYGAKDELVDALTSDPSLLGDFLSSIGLSDAQIAQAARDPALMASIIGKIYDIPDSELNFQDEKDATLVALGTTTPKFTGVETGDDLASVMKDTEDIKSAEVIGYNYSSKDALTTISDPTKGFSSSDVALLKINIKDAPALRLDSTQVTQNEKILVMGFPGDADNTLTDNNQLSVSVTDGVISSIREAAGGTGRLFQSDADASHGNSGGPAIDEAGNVIGLLTYRIASDSSGNAAKSYIRDIGDFQKLAKSKNVTLSGVSKTQQLWEQGLSLYSQNHFSAAMKNFQKVKDAYPASRLADTYINSSKAAIAAGRDVKTFPVPVLVAAIAVGVIALGAAIWMVVRHRVHHQLYRQTQAGGASGAPQPATVPQPSAPPTAQPQGFAAPTAPVSQTPTVPTPPAQPTVIAPGQPSSQQPPQGPRLIQ